MSHILSKRCRALSDAFEKCAPALHGSLCRLVEQILHPSTDIADEVNRVAKGRKRASETQELELCLWTGNGRRVEYHRKLREGRNHRQHSRYGTCRA